MAVTNGGELREWRRSRGWDVPELARRLRRAADEPVAAHEGLVTMIREDPLTVGANRSWLKQFQNADYAAVGDNELFEAK